MNRYKHCQEESMDRIFRKCFPQLRIDPSIFLKLLRISECTVLLEEGNETMQGFSILSENNIRLLCVSPEFRGQGIGTTLLFRSEEWIRKQGFHTSILGGLDSELFLGAVMDEHQWYENENSYFERLGYKAKDRCIEMKLDLKEFQLETFKENMNPEGISFCYYDGDKTDLLKAVRLVEKEWEQYYVSELPVLVAMKQGKIVGFSILGFDEETLLSDGSNKVGSIGCVGVIPEVRNQGIGLALVAQGTKELQRMQCDVSWIHYTYLEQWYGMLGYHTFLRYWFGEKDLNLQNRLSTYLHAFLWSHEFPKEAKDVLISLWETIHKNDRVSDAFLRSIHRFCEDEAIEIQKEFRDLSKMAEEIEVEPYSLHLLYLICISIHSGELYERASFSQDEALGRQVLYDSLEDFKISMYECRLLYQIWGTHYATWQVGFCNASLLQLGRLQYGTFRLWREYGAGDTHVAENGLVIEAHIPSGQPLNHEECLKSYAMAENYYRKKYQKEFGQRPIPIFVASWLLYPPLKEALVPGGNIEQFVFRL